MELNRTVPPCVQEGEQVKSNVKRSNIFNEFFWICSGANRHILRQCPTEYSKYYSKFSNFKSCSLEYIGISTEAQSIDKISSYSKTNFIPTTGGKTFNVLFRIPTMLSVMNNLLLMNFMRDSTLLILLSLN